MNVCLQWLLLGTLIASPSMLRAEDTASLRARLSTVDAASSLEDTTLKPWHLKVSFQLFDEKGKPGEQGTMEEWWNSPDQYKLTYTSPSYASTELRNQDGFFGTTGAGPVPYMLDLLHKELVRPMPPEQNLRVLTPKLRKLKLEKVKLDCIRLDLSGKPAGPVQMPLESGITYCLDQGNMLRVTYVTPSMWVGRNIMGTFQQHSVALDLFVSDPRHQLMTAHVTTLESVAAEATKFAPGPSMSIGKNNLSVGSRVMAGRKIGGPPPQYPYGARMNHISGSVLLSAVIGTDGHIHHLEVISSADDDLSSAAIDAVKQWVYQPYLLNGVPVEVNTTITINFNIG